ncbi:MAG: hypothetical protein KDA42_19740 [Planctomycetales bacterium]|nr:hypothetical protein [Planctomycetales bacterium]
MHNNGEICERLFRTVDRQMRGGKSEQEAVDRAKAILDKLVEQKKISRQAADKHLHDVHKEVSEFLAGITTKQFANGTFTIINWIGYPIGVRKPIGPFRLITGAEYANARRAANNANAALRRANPQKYAGKQIHEIQPVKFGGSPTDPGNKIALTPAQHRQYNAFWYRIQRQLAR